MTSIGYTNPIGGSNVLFRFLAMNPESPGGAIKGYMPQTTQLTDKRYIEYQQIRTKLREGWNTKYRSQLKPHKLKKSITTPFRAVNNAGDLLSRENFSCGGTCQSYQSRPNMHGLSSHFGRTSSSCLPSVAYNSLQLLKDVPSATCNVKYVYDSSDYTTYLKQQAINKNFNAYSYGGDQSNASQVALKSSKRF
jgi:hypothetical protein